MQTMFRTGYIDKLQAGCVSPDVARESCDIRPKGFDAPHYRGACSGYNCPLIPLLPLDVDFEIVGGVAQGLAARGLDPGQIGRVPGEYKPGDHRIRLRADKAISDDGTSMPLKLEIQL